MKESNTSTAATTALITTVTAAGTPGMLKTTAPAYTPIIWVSWVALNVAAPFAILNACALAPSIDAIHAVTRGI